MERDGDRDRERSSSVASLLGALVLLPLLYTLSIGPVAFVCEKLGVPKEPMRAFYRPVVWLHDHTPLKRPLEWYLSLFGLK